MFSFINRKCEEEIETDLNSNSGNRIEDNFYGHDYYPEGYISVLATDVNLPDNMTYTATDNTVGDWYVPENHFISRLRATEYSNDIDEQIGISIELLFDSFCKKYPNEAEIWKMQLKLSNNDYLITVQYIIEYLQKSLMKKEEKLVK